MDSDDEKKPGLADESSTEQETEVDMVTPLTYGLRSYPPMAVTVMAALQHSLLAFSSILATASVVGDASCVPYSHPLRSQLFCTSMFMVGFCTIMETALGIRLPIFQGPSATFLVPLLTMATDKESGCQASEASRHQNISDTQLTNITNALFNGTASNSPHNGEFDIEFSYYRLQQMAGSLILASLVEVVLGGLGILHFLLRFIGPITVSVTITMVGVSLVEVPLIYGRASFPLAFCALALVLIFVLYLERVPIPIPRCRTTEGQSRFGKFYIFMLLPILLGMLVTWVLAAILTSFDVFSSDPKDTSFMARSDAKADMIINSPWIHITYPGQFGLPRFNNLAVTIGFTVACISSLVESVGDYYAAQSACRAPRPPSHALSRGIFIEGIGSVLSGLVGAGHATTSYSGNIAILTITKTASRVVMYVAGIFLILMSLIGKAGAALSAIPNPVLGGVMMVLVGTLISIGLSSLKGVDLTSSRNILVVGTPIMAGLVMPRGLEMYPDIFLAGSPEVNRIIKVVLGTPMFLGAFLALILDNTVPDKSEKKSHVSHQCQDERDNQGREIYSWPIYPKILNKLPFLKYVPFLPKDDWKGSFDSLPSMK